MAVLDWVRHTANCPKCKTPIHDWQTKEGRGEFSILEPWQVTHFYSVCFNCGTPIDAFVDAEVQHIVHKCIVRIGVGKKKKKGKGKPHELQKHHLQEGSSR